MTRPEERLKNLRDTIETMAEATEGSITKEYAIKLDDTRDLIRKLHDKYASGGALTYAEMAKYGRIDKLNKQLAEIMQGLYKENKKLTTSILRDTYKESFTTSKDVIQDIVGKTIRGEIKSEVIQRAIENPVSGLTLPDRLEKNRNQIIYKVRETVGQGLVEGESYSDMSKRLKDTFEGDYSKAERVVRTETHRVMEQGKLDTLDHAANQGLKMQKRWVTAEDSRVRSSHTHMNDKTVGYNEDFVNSHTGGSGPAPGMLGVASDDINCRCIFVVEKVK